MGKSMLKHFTLIELLMVVAIISVLASLLLPSISKARDMGRSSACKGGLRQCGVGFHLYSGDYGGWIPQGSGLSNCAYANFSILMINLGYVPCRVIQYNPASGYGVYPAGNVFCCPSLPPPSAYRAGGGNYYGTPSSCTTFGVRICGGAYLYPGERIDASTIRAESVYSACPYIVDTVARYADQSGNFSGNGQRSTWWIASDFTQLNGDGALQLRHSLKANSWFIDGHAAGLGSCDLQNIKQASYGRLSSSAVTYFY